MGNSQALSVKGPWAIMRDWFIRHPYWALALLTVVALALFLAKPFNLDDPLFVWAAQQIQSHPADPYGFNVNWFGFSQPMCEAMLNPPLMSYYLAIAAGVLGWSEIGLHLACLLFSVAVVLGTYRLASNLCRWPIYAALATLFTPGVLVSSTTVMCDIPMLAFWIWAIVFWTEGIKRNDLGRLAVAGILIGLATLTKFNGVCLIPLAAAYGWIEKRSIGPWLAFLLIPIAMIFAHEWVTAHVYGRSHFFAANQFAQTHQVFQGLARLTKAYIGITFIGGCFAVALFCWPYLWSPRESFLIMVTGILLFALSLAAGLMGRHYLGLGGRWRFVVEVQILLWSVGGVSLLALALADVWRNRDAGSWMLVFWVFGIFAYAAFFYFMINARALLPMAPAVAILIARRLGERVPIRPIGVGIPLAASAAISLLAAQADFRHADTARRTAGAVCAKYRSASGRLWFQGHWGFQYYMQLAGAWAVDLQRPSMASGDFLAVPEWNSNQLAINPETTSLDYEFSIPDFPWFATLNIEVGAGFYSSFWGPLPFAFGPVPPQKVSIYALKNLASDSH